MLSRFASTDCLTTLRKLRRYFERLQAEGEFGVGRIR